MRQQEIGQMQPSWKNNLLLGIRDGCCTIGCILVNEQKKKLIIIIILVNIQKRRNKLMIIMFKHISKCVVECISMELCHATAGKRGHRTRATVKKRLGRKL